MVDYTSLTHDLSKVITQRYSTSFTHGIKMLAPRYREAIYSIYGFVRFADEIVDTFFDQDQQRLLADFKAQTYEGIKNRLSTNPVIHAFQATHHKYNLPIELTNAFFRSMEMDLDKKDHNENSYNDYIYGSAEVVGLICLKVFCDGDENQYRQLLEPAKRLGAAFQKVNFLRDMQSDYKERGRVYFPDVDFTKFDEQSKQKIEADIDADFRAAYPGMMQLPKGVQPGVYTAFIYYRNLFKKLQSLPPQHILSARIRVPDYQKLLLLMRTFSKYGLKPE